MGERKHPPPTPLSGGPPSLKATFALIRSPDSQRISRCEWMPTSTETTLPPPPLEPPSVQSERLLRARPTDQSPSVSGQTNSEGPRRWNHVLRPLSQIQQPQNGVLNCAPLCTLCACFRADRMLAWEPHRSLLVDCTTFDGRKALLERSEFFVSNCSHPVLALVLQALWTQQLRGLLRRSMRRRAQRTIRWW